MPSEMNKIIDIRSKISHFNVLVIGRANAGKTTLLKKVCNSVEDPEIFSQTGEKIDASVVEGCAERGEHDIKNQLIFKSNPQFIFHDSRGFESGSIDETEKVKAFITERAASGQLSTQLHIIWYCLPTDTNRTLLAADEQFFNNASAGKVPVIAIFTKFDGLVTQAFVELRGDGATHQEAMTGKQEKALEMLTTDFVEPLQSTKFHPVQHLHLGNMHEADSTCSELMEKTANALDDGVLQLLFVSVQRNNIELSISYAVHNAWRQKCLSDIVKTSLAYFPHTWSNAKYDEQLSHEEEYSAYEEEEYEYIFLSRVYRPPTSSQYSRIFLNNVESFILSLILKRPSLMLSSRTQKGRAELVAAICIVAEQTFTESAAMSKVLGRACSVALKAYLGSDLERDVKHAIAQVPPEDLVRDGPSIPKLVEITRSRCLRINAGPVDTPSA